MTDKEGTILVIDKYMQYGFRDALRSLWRHKGMVFVTIFTVATMLLVLGATALVALNSQHATNEMEDQLEIVVFLESTVTREDAVAMESTFSQITGLREVIFVPKEDALKNMGEKFESTTSLTEALGGVNPLPDAYHIKVEHAEQIAGAVKFLERQPQIEMIRYGKDMVNNMMNLTKVIGIACVAIVTGMLIVALFLINSTIRLTVATRSEEITIMKYVGATNLYVRIPFFLEGLFIGIVGAIFADIILYFGYQYILTYLMTNLSFVPVLDSQTILLQVMLILLVGGMALGAIGSNIAVKKYLNV